MPDGPDRRVALPDGGDEPPSDADDVSSGGKDDRAGRGTRVVVALVVALGVVTLYVALGGPIPFVIDGGPSLDSVPAEADAVVYADAWTFVSSSSQEIADGLLATTNRSLPGYTGPASLQAAAEKLQDTQLNPEALRSVTAFGAYTAGTGPGDYRAVILNTRWKTDPLLRVFGGNASDYERRTYRNATVYVHEDPDAQFSWVGVLGPDQFVLGTEAAVTDAIDANAGRGGGIDPRLDDRFDSLKRGPLRFAATMPDSLPGEGIAPPSLVETLDAVETLSGVYYPTDDGTAVELSVTARDGETVRRLEPAVDGAIAFASEHAPDRTIGLLEDASITRSDATLTVSLSGPSDAFVDGYRAILETGLVRLLLGQPVGRPALDLVPADADVVAYGDAAVVVDPTTLGFVDALAGGNAAGATLADVVERIRNATTLDVTALRSVTAFASADEAGAIVQAYWDDGELASTLEENDVDYRRRSVDDVVVFEVDAAGRRAWIGVLDDGRLAVGTPAAVEAVVGVANGSRLALGAPLRPAFERLPRGYATAVARVPANLSGVDSRLRRLVSGLAVVGGTYDTNGSRVSVRVDLGFESESAAESAGGTVELLRRLVRTQVDNESVAELLDGTTLTRDGQVLTARLATDPATVVAAIEFLVGEADPILPATRPAPSREGPPPNDGAAHRHRYVPGAGMDEVITS